MHRPYPSTSGPAASILERNSPILDGAVRRVGAIMLDHEIDLDVLRRSLETEMVEGLHTRVELMKVGRRQVLRSLGRKARKAKAQC